LTAEKDLKGILSEGRIVAGINQMRDAGHELKKAAAALIMGADILEGMRLRALETLSDEDAKHIVEKADALYNKANDAFVKAQDGHWDIVEVMDAYFNDGLSR